MKFKALIFGLALAFPFTVVAQTNPNNKQLSNSDQQFLKKLAREDTSEIHLAHMALKKASNPAVKSYARQILDADPGMRQQAKRVAQKNGISVPSSASAQQKAEYNKLAKLSGRKFDRAYIRYEAGKQKKDLNLVKNEVNTTKNQELKSYASFEEPMVRGAAKSAATINTTMNASMSASGTNGYARR